MSDPAGTTPLEPREAGAATERFERGSAQPELVEEDLLVEDVSIDGMCGVY